MGLPVARSQTMVVSRWLVMPMAATSLGCALALAKASSATAICDAAISSGSCSTHPGWGKICVELALGHGPDGAFMIEQESPRTGSALIERENVTQKDLLLFCKR